MPKLYFHTKDASLSNPKFGWPLKSPNYIRATWSSGWLRPDNSRGRRFGSLTDQVVVALSK